eukprot:TRINITY_DN5286_c0_g1_i2.p1 TRINITY_DN5286_c0_g1~~TRINITY_DN5286_c0_g1_i2.p1  ORF type:complete len:284 (-),score=87.89 TRINITY_DN5286_c0_g1_i2:145-969(-)
MSRVIVLSLAVLYSAALAAAQDPATGWMAYAVGTLPSGTERLTHLEMKWKVSNNPRPSFAFFSPWFGADTTDNLFLIQPVNPWEGGQWNGYCENFIWQPVYNQDSPSFSVSPGQTMHGIMTYDASSDSYNVTQSCVETGATSSLQAKVPNGKKVTIPYVVYEKTWPCRDYPSDEKVTFYDIKASCDNQDCTSQVKWEAKVKDANCDFAAHINSNNTIDITWNTQAASKYDGMTLIELHELNNKGWAKTLNLPRPSEQGKPVKSVNSDKKVVVPK